jgi:hypothetical protein
MTSAAFAIAAERLGSMRRRTRLPANFFSCYMPISGIQLHLACQYKRHGLQIQCFKTLSGNPAGAGWIGPLFGRENAS